MSQKMTLYMETTKKKPEETISEIQSVLKKFGVRNVLIDYDDNGEVEGVSFTLRRETGFIPYRLPADHKPLWKMSQQGKTKYIRTEEQARRVAWRQILRWVEAQLALIQIEMTKAEEIFLPYMLVDKNKTVYDQYLERGFAGYLTPEKGEEQDEEPKNI